MSRAYLIGGLVALVCLAIGVYYLIPGIDHVLAFSGSATDPHVKHALAFFALAIIALAIIALVGARFAANAETMR